MNDRDLHFWASQCAKQRRYALDRRAWAAANGRPYLLHSRSNGRPK